MECPQTGVMLTAGSLFSISNQCLACCGVGPRLSIIQELGSILLPDAEFAFVQQNKTLVGEIQHPGQPGLQMRADY